MTEPTWDLFLAHLLPWAVWSLLGSAVMATLLEGAQLLGFSRMSLPFLMGTVVTDGRRQAMITGYVVYLFGGWLFGVLYALVLGSFAGVPYWPTCWAGCAWRLLHGAFLSRCSCRCCRRSIRV